jgi:dienelactone hydrolase
MSTPRAVRITLGGHLALDGDLHVPAQARGIVLFAHGSGSSRHSPRNRYVADVLAQARLSTLLIDLLTREEEEEERTTRHHRFNVAMLAERLEAATEWASSESSTCALRIGYFGASTGAAAALIAAAALRERVHAVVSRGGRPDLAGPVLSQVRAPTLLIVGGADRGVLELNREACRALGAAKELRIIPGAQHLFEEPGALKQVALLSTQWFVEHLSSAHRQRSHAPGARAPNQHTR